MDILDTVRCAQYFISGSIIIDSYPARELGPWKSISNAQGSCKRDTSGLWKGNVICL